jgi:hypothetical protein
VVSRPDQQQNSKGVARRDQAIRPRFPGFFHPAVAVYLARIGRIPTIGTIPPRIIAETDFAGEILPILTYR